MTNIKVRSTIIALLVLPALMAVYESSADPPQEVSLKPPVRATPVDNLNLLPGFSAELLYTVPKATQGSWVSLAKDNKGNLIAGDQGALGLFQITPARLGDPESTTSVKKINVALSGAQGLCWAFDSLYVNVNGKVGGVSRVTDSDGDGELDKAELILPLSGAGEHGPHAVVPTADGKSIIVMGGNYTHMPKWTSSRVPTNWQEDLLLPRQWDAKGHAKGLMAPGGWIAIMSPGGSQVELFSTGYRNPYDVAVLGNGEMFTYDADMEWDMGTPWYRPTRICHAVSGSEFGWRSGAGKSPVYFEDSLPPALNIGPGSPTGVVSGVGAKFPARYQDAIYALDWTFGTIHCVLLQPEGASYKGVAEEFISGIPLPVTDAVIGDDGAFYFTVGGRGTQSALYRVFYNGSESTDPSPVFDKPEAAAARRLRQQLESYHGRPRDDGISVAWPHLGSPDRFIRNAARVAIESQPVEGWQQKSLDEKDPQIAILALMALARQGDKSIQPELIKSLNRIDITGLTEQQRLSLLRTYALCFMRMGRPNQTQQAELNRRFDAVYPSRSDAGNTELARLLVYLDSPTVVAKTLKLMAEAKPARVPAWGELIKRNNEYGSPISKMLDDMPPLQEIQFALFLCNVRFGWTIQQRRQYFEWFIKAGKHPGGLSYTGFLDNIRAEALEHCSEAERQALSDITGQSITPVMVLEVKPPAGPGRKWTLNEAVTVANAGLRGRDFESGRNLFHAVSCAKCHRFDGEGGDIGPDLTSVSGRLSVRDLLENIIDPSKVISDQYGSHQVETADGITYEGRVIDPDTEDPNGVLHIFTKDTDGKGVVVKKTEVEEMRPSKLSQMPTGLLDELNQDELLDLVAYLLSRGNPDDRMFGE
ncbi:MAG: c-type cytochrome [Planctomycetales bacterium]